MTTTIKKIQEVEPERQIEKKDQLLDEIKGQALKEITAQRQQEKDSNRFRELSEKWGKHSKLLGFAASVVGLSGKRIKRLFSSKELKETKKEILEEKGGEILSEEQEKFYHQVLSNYADGTAQQDREVFDKVLSNRTLWQKFKGSKFVRGLANTRIFGETTVGDVFMRMGMGGGRFAGRVGLVAGGVIPGSTGTGVAGGTIGTAAGISDTATFGLTGAMGGLALGARTWALQRGQKYSTQGWIDRINAMEGVDEREKAEILALAIGSGKVRDGRNQQYGAFLAAFELHKRYEQLQTGGSLSQDDALTAKDRILSGVKHRRKRTAEEFEQADSPLKKKAFDRFQKELSGVKKEIAGKVTTSFLAGSIISGAIATGVKKFLEYTGLNETISII